MKKSFTVLDLPKNERPRERLNLYGPGSLSLPELIALILGKGIKGESVIITAQKTISHFNNLTTMSQASIQDLQCIKGIGFAKATQLMACFELAKRINNIARISKKPRYKNIVPQEIFNLVRQKIENNTKEHFFLVSLDIRVQIIAIDLISIGTLNASLVHPREVFKMAISRHAASVIFVHNHPSQQIDPSDEDISLTSRLIEAGNIMGINVLDHLIISLHDYFSLKENSMI
jgi:DNA repair protein RadC